MSIGRRSIRPLAIPLVFFSDEAFKKLRFVKLGKRGLFASFESILLWYALGAASPYSLLLVWEPVGEIIISSGDGITNSFCWNRDMLPLGRVQKPPRRHPKRPAEERLIAKLCSDTG